MRHILAIICFVVLLSTTTYCKLTRNSLYTQSKKGKYVPPSNKDLQAVEELFDLLFSGKFDDQTKKMANEQGFELIKLPELKQSFWALLEMNEKRYGRGFYLFREKAFWKIALQIPHGIKDVHTGKIGMRLFKSGKFISLALNTVPRDYLEGKAKIDADLAHLNQSYFTAYTKSFVKKIKEGVIIQIHGFSQDKRKTEVGSRADIIISPGLKVVVPKVTNLQTCLGLKMNVNILVYPSQINELGGTTNVPGKIINAVNVGHFFHFEFAKKTRILLRNQKKAQRSFLDCIESVLL